MPDSGGVASQYRVPLRVYFRAFCPACQWFVSDPLLELVRNEQLLPAAGMVEEKNGKLVCEGGSLECTGHRLEVCMIDKDRNDVVKYLGSIACMEGDESGHVGDWGEKMKNCLTTEERAVVDTCFKTKSEQLLREMIQKEHAGNVEWMPYTVVEQKVLGSETQGVGLGELQASFYPDACLKLVGEQKIVAAVEDNAAAHAPAQAAPIDPAAAAEKAEEEELELAIREEATASGKVRLEVFWRAFCPGCMAFITKPLLNLLRDEQFRNVIDFRPVPAAGTSFDSTGKFVCSMGMVECIGHKWMSCAVDLFPKVDELIEYLACLESKDNKGVTWSFVVNKCFPGDNAKKMQACYDTRGDDLLKKHVAQREKVDVLWVPYVVINGASIGDARHGIGYKQLSGEICKAYTGPFENRPNVCQPKRLRAENEKAEPAKETDKVIKPCPPKKDAKNKDKAAAALIDEDAPGIGARIDADFPQAKANALATGPDADDDTSSGLNSLVLPGLCVAVIAFAAFRYSGDHKKDA
uniref:Thioredoxin domain-containing protein n=1 Tax=Globisporangium ultimum (strain ATCC 200006 / CBS 805.95 / DAOM BR144) TaxID=431595 RepID=K3WZP8_GLOUD